MRKFILVRTIVAAVVIVLIGFLSKNASAQVHDDYEPDNSINTATVINYGETQMHNLPEARDEDWYRVILPKFGKVRVSLQTFGAQADIRVDMYDQISGGRGYGFSGTGGGPFPGDGTFLESVTAQYPGIYYLKITRFRFFRRPFDSPTYDYQVAVDYTVSDKVDNGDTALPDRYEPDDWITEATPLPPRVIQEHTFDAGDDRDWYVLRVSGCVKVLVEVASVLDQTIGIRYYNTSLRQLGSAKSNTQNEQLEYAYLAQDLRQGIYYVLVDRGPQDGNGSFGNEYSIRGLGFQCDTVPIIMAPIIDLLMEE